MADLSEIDEVIGTFWIAEYLLAHKRRPLNLNFIGEMPEWLNGTASKVVVGRPTQGSNPCLSAIVDAQSNPVP